MKKIALLLAFAGLFLSAQPVWARCTSLINEGRELLSKATLPENEAGKIKGLLDEAQKFRDSGDHNNGFQKATEALNLLKKK